MPIMSRKFYSRFSPAEFNASVGLLIGSGAYRLEDPEDWKPGALIKLVRNDRYWGTLPAIDQLIYPEISNDVAALTAFRNGDTDIFGAPPPFTATPEQWIAMIKDPAILSRTRHYEYVSPLAGYRYIAWNQRDQDGKPTVFADKRVRQAMTMLLDRDMLLKVVMLGKAVATTGPFSPLSKQYNPDVKPWPYDVARAQSLLREAGLSFNASEGVLHLPDGQPFRFKLTYPSGSANYEKMVLFVKDSLAKAGIAMDPDPLEWAVFTDRLERKNFQAISLGWTANIEIDIYQEFHSSQMVAGGDDFMSYKNEELDKLIEQARQTMDESERMALWRRCHAILAQDQPYTFLFFSKSLAFIDKRVENVQLVKLGLNPLEDWFVPSPLQKWTKD
jgi:peptide/nickel transport system substrate-binding protein